MQQTQDRCDSAKITTFDELIRRIDYSLMNQLRADPEATADGNDHQAREVMSGHFVPVKPTPLPQPAYVCHSRSLFHELGLKDDLAQDPEFLRLFSGDISVAREPMRSTGWATGYALSIYGTEYIQQCPFRTGNGYGDGRAISVFEGLFEGRRWEMQLKGGGPTPYCRGADGRAVLRSSVREFLAQEFMHALGVPTSRSLTLYVSGTETVARPWYSEGSTSFDPDVLTDNPVAISTRVAPSFLRVGQLELFGRRARSKAHPSAYEELRMIVSHLIEREYREEIDPDLDFTDQVIALSRLFRTRLISLVANWLRVGYCQGNFNSDNCAAGGFTLDYGPFGFCETFDPAFQPWTGGGRHFAFLNQPVAAEANFQMFWTALRPLLSENVEAVNIFDEIRHGFAAAMETEIQSMWASKLGLPRIDSTLLNNLLRLMHRSKADYTMTFRALSDLPETITPLRKCFLEPSSDQLDSEWSEWLQSWHAQLPDDIDPHAIRTAMKNTNPRYTWREWLIVPAYQQAEQGETDRILELQDLFSHPYDDQSLERAEKYDQLRPPSLLNAGGISHYSCSS